jgi:hypothetical protein
MDHAGVRRQGLDDVGVILDVDAPVVGSPSL